MHGADGVVDEPGVLSDEFGVGPLDVFGGGSLRSAPAAVDRAAGGVAWAESDLRVGLALELDFGGFGSSLMLVEREREREREREM